MLLSLPKSANAAPELYPSMTRAVFVLRWATVAVLLVLTLLVPRLGLGGIPNWLLLIAFALYTLLVDFASSFLPELRSPANRAMSDLPVVVLVYYLNAEAGSPVFVLIFLAVMCAAVGMSLRGSLLFTLVAAGLTVLAEGIMPGWALSAANVRELGTRVVVLGIAGIGAALLTARLTLERESAREAQDRTARLEELDRQRSNFISSVSHDLRTPFTAIRAGIGLLQTSMADRMRPDEQELIGDIERVMERLGMYINDLVVFNQLEAGVLKLESEALDLRSVATNAIMVVHSQIQEKGQTLEADLPESLPACGDARKLEQVIVNLLDNAHRHTPPRTCISIAGRTGPEEIVLAVSDDGPGIYAGEHERIFQQFYRHSQAEGGWGMGLAIARAIAELHSGRVWVESTPGNGSTFYIALPRG